MMKGYPNYATLNMNFKTQLADNWKLEIKKYERMHFKARIFIDIMFYNLTIFAFSIFRWYRHNFLTTLPLASTVIIAVLITVLKIL